MKDQMKRRDFLKASAGVAAGIGLSPLAFTSCRAAPAQEELFNISLAQWSLHRRIYGDSLDRLGVFEWGRALKEDYGSVLAGDLDPLEFARTARQEYDIGAIEYVNTCFYDKAEDRDYLGELKTRADGEGVQSLLIMCDFEGALGDPDEQARIEAVENHHKWVEAAAFLGCHSIRVNALSRGSFEEQQQLAADGLRRLAEFADGHGINVLVENHGGYSSHGKWLAGVMDMAGHPRVGTLPDFGNFRVKPEIFTESAQDEPEEWYDRYLGVEELMPYAKAVSAKSHEFDADGNEVNTDFSRMMKIVMDAGYRGYVGIEYEGTTLSEADGIRATKALLERVRDQIAADYE
jgi:sugar phosphate isomerase/epimerase